MTVEDELIGLVPVAVTAGMTMNIIDKSFKIGKTRRYKRRRKR